MDPLKNIKTLTAFNQKLAQASLSSKAWGRKFTIQGKDYSLNELVAKLQKLETKDKDKEALSKAVEHLLKLDIVPPNSASSRAYVHMVRGIQNVAKRTETLKKIIGDKGLKNSAALQDLATVSACLREYLNVVGPGTEDAKVMAKRIYEFFSKPIFLTNTDVTDIVNFLIPPSQTGMSPVQADALIALFVGLSKAQSCQSRSSLLMDQCLAKLPSNFPITNAATCRAFLKNLSPDLIEKYGSTLASFQSPVVQDELGSVVSKIVQSTPFLQDDSAASPIRTFDQMQEKVQKLNPWKFANDLRGLETSEQESARFSGHWLRSVASLDQKFILSLQKEVCCSTDKAIASAEQKAWEYLSQKWENPAATPSLQGLNQQQQTMLSQTIARIGDKGLQLSLGKTISPGMRQFIQGFSSVIFPPDAQEVSSTRSSAQQQISTNWPQDSKTAWEELEKFFQTIGDANENSDTLFTKIWEQTTNPQKLDMVVFRTVKELEQDTALNVKEEELRSVFAYLQDKALYMQKKLSAEPKLQDYSTQDYSTDDKKLLRFSHLVDKVIATLDEKYDESSSDSFSMYMRQFLEECGVESIDE
jgi:hypothetical protein